MNPHLCRIVLRPRNPFEVFDLTWRFLRERGRPVLRMAAITVLPAWVVLGLAAWLSGGHWAVGVATLLVAPLVRSPFTLLAGRLLFADEVRLRDVLWGLLRRLPALLLTAGVILGGWALASLTCFALTPLTRGVHLWLPETALLERVPARRGTRRAARLAGGQVGTAAVGVIAEVALTVWGGLAGEAIGQALVGFVLQLGQPFGSLLSIQVTPYVVGGVLLVQPIYAIYRLLLYVDARTRQEGWDLQVGLRAAGLAR